MDRLERLVVELVGHEGLPIDHLIERKVGRVVAVAVRRHVAPRGIDLDGLQQGVDADGKPFGVELGPFRDAADVDGVGLRGEFLKFLPAPGHRRPDEALDRERPSVERGMGRRSRREHREVRDQVLTRR